MAKQAAGLREQSANLEHLSIFCGVWNTEGEIAATEDAPAMTLLATDIYEWLPGRHFLLHRVDARMGGAASRSIEIYSYDPKRNAYLSRSYDDQGVTEEFRANLAGRKWTITGENLRFSGEFATTRNKLAGRWEKRAGRARWTALMDIQLTRA
jgi:hypothetical protein